MDVLQCVQKSQHLAYTYSLLSCMYKILILILQYLTWIILYHIKIQKLISIHHHYRTTLFTIHTHDGERENGYPQCVCMVNKWQ